VTPTREVTCIRCDEPRWTSAATPYMCQRCNEALAGGNVIGPLPTDAQRRARQIAGNRLSARGAEDLLAWRALQGLRSRRQRMGYPVARSGLI